MKTSRLIIAALSLLTLAGVWLFAAPFGLGYQPLGAPWSNATLDDLASGGALILIGLGSLTTYCVLSTRDLLARTKLEPAGDSS
jgi:cytochrome c oxidase assembly factor CtaG